MQQDIHLSSMATLIRLCPAYRQKVENLFAHSQTRQLSESHRSRSIILNPKAVFNLLESQFLISQEDDHSLYFKLKTQVMRYVERLNEEFPLNAKFIYQEAFLVVEHNRKINIIAYLLSQIQKTFRLISKKNEQIRALMTDYQQACTMVFYQICANCTLRTSELQTITSHLADFYYEEALTPQLVSHSFRLLDAGLQQRNISPFVYFLDSRRSDSVRVLLSNNKWCFGRGMTLWVWVNMMKEKDCWIWRMETQKQEQIGLRVVQGMLVAQATTEAGQVESVKLEAIPLNTNLQLGIELEAVSEGLFKTHFNFNVNFNGSLHSNIPITLPKFESAQFVSEFTLLNGFIGKLFGVVLTAKAELSQWEGMTKWGTCGVSGQKDVWSMIESGVLRQDSILTVLNAQRSFEGLLINYVFEGNHACFEGRVSQVKYHKYDSKIIDIYMPFLHLLGLAQPHDLAWVDLFDMVLQHIFHLIDDNSYVVDSILLLLYFLQRQGYPIRQSTLDFIVDTPNRQPNPYIDIVCRYFDPQVLSVKGLAFSLTEFVDPVEKTTLLFHLQTAWKEKWNRLQGFEGWWSPSFLHPQNNNPFNPEDFAHSLKREERVQWSVLNLVTRDYCKCFIEPVFKVPAYADRNPYQQQYVAKECFNQPFTVNLNFPTKKPTLTCGKTSNSAIDKIKSKLFKPRQILLESSRKRMSATEIKQWSAPVVFIDILTVVMGYLSIKKEGVVLFTSAHCSRRFDHMCVKAFKNEVFYYISMPFSEISLIYRKRFNASPDAVYIKTREGRENMFYFPNKNTEEFLGVVEGVVEVKRDPYASYLKSQEPFRWVDRAMSNWEYLQWLNQIAGRNYNDITQYPVLPWVFVGEEVNDAPPPSQQHKYYRDLTKNMGSHGSKERVSRFIEKYESNNEQQLFNEYHFGTHYSSSAIIFNYLIRIRPYSIGALTLQSGSFDCADRIFYSYCGSWNNAITSNTDIRELIPEIYTLPEMFINLNNYAYGLTQEKVAVDNVILPSWAEGNPYVFVATLRKQLQTRRVSQRINEWIDLIYGYKQRGKDAIEHMNIFYPLTYENCIDLDKVTQADQRESFQTQIAHFGQNPAQIIGNNPHPTRRVKPTNWEGRLVADGGELLIQKCFLAKGSPKEDKYLFKSVFEGRNSILGVKFINEDHFLVLRKQDYFLFRILNRKGDFLSKEEGTAYELEVCPVGLNYKQLQVYVPIISLGGGIVLVGGFFHGYVNIIFLGQSKFNRTFHFPTATITAMGYCFNHHSLYLGDEEGYLHGYRVKLAPSQIDFEAIRTIKAHDSRINDVSVSAKANLLCCCAEDGTVSLFNLYSQVVRRLEHPTRGAVHLVRLSTNPLYALVFYSRQDSTVYVYSINGQFLDSIAEKTGFIYNMSILPATDSTQCLAYLNGLRQLFVWQLPYLRLRRKVRVKRDQFRISSFGTSEDGRMAVCGTEDGALQLIANPQSY